MSELPIGDLLSLCGADGLGKAPSAEARAEVLREVAGKLNGADPLHRATVRQALRDRGFPAGMVDPALEVAAPRRTETEPEGQGSRLALTDPETWSETVDGAALLDSLSRTFARFLALAVGAADVLALWTVHAHGHAAAVISPILALTSPEKRCGKTTLLSVLAGLVPRPLPAANITAAALFRAVEQLRPTLLVDEADTFLRDQSELRGVLNSGHRRDLAVVVRTVGDDHEARAFSTWCPKVVALIGKLPPTLADRSIEVRMRRRLATESVEPFRADRSTELEPLRRQAWTWAHANLDTLATADPKVPPELNDRAADSWRPLLAIADLAGDDWPERARRAARLLSASVDDDSEGAGVLLLADLRTMFERHQVDRLPSRTILRELVGMEERPWPEWKRGNELTPRGLAKLLKPFEVSSRTIKLADGSTAKGYLAAEFEDAFERYLPSDPPAVSVTPSPWRKSATNEGSASVTGNRAVTDSDSREGAEVRDGYAVTDNEPLLWADADYEAAEREGLADA